MVVIWTCHLVVVVGNESGSFRPWVISTESFWPNFGVGRFGHIDELFRPWVILVQFQYSGRMEHGGVWYIG